MLLETILKFFVTSTFMSLKTTPIFSNIVTLVATSLPGQVQILSGIARLLDACVEVTWLPHGVLWVPSYTMFAEMSF